MSSAAASARPEILIAEDSVTQARHLIHILETHHFRVTHAVNGRLALDAARRSPPALVISDVMMPEMTGYELCMRLKEDPLLSRTPVILVTTLSDPQDVIRGLECHADNFVPKPYDPELLMRRVHFLLANGHMQGGDAPDRPLEIKFDGHRHVIATDRLRILNLLLSTYEAAIQRNKELSTTRDTLRETNEELQQLTQELENRVQLRTHELEQSNQALRQAQKALIQQERLSALGQMASGMAHDINNALSPVALYTESLLERETSLSERARTQLTAIERAVSDVARTLARMREFYRPQEQEAQLSDVALNELVEQVVELTRARWGVLCARQGITIQVKTLLAANLDTIGGAAHEIRDALTNLIFNAVDAMPKGGTITVRTSSHAGPAGHGAHRYVQLEVEDTGTGMDEETRRKCLEPFFTTKGERGTGLGLAMVYGMAQRHRAELEVASKRGVGTTIRFLFPVRAH